MSNADKWVPFLYHLEAASAYAEEMRLAELQVIVDQTIAVAGEVRTSEIRDLWRARVKTAAQHMRDFPSA